jgi:hypothetical protein
MEATAEKEAEWVQHHDAVANATLLMRTQSWYTGDNIEGKPRSASQRKFRAVSRSVSSNSPSPAG